MYIGIDITVGLSEKVSHKFASGNKSSFILLFLT